MRSAATTFEEIRHDLHRHAQASACEEYAHDLIVRYMSTLRPTRLWNYVGTNETGRAYGVAAVWGDEPSNPTVVFRADSDALPIIETTDVPYRSENAGQAHKCGHDGHTTILLALASKVDAAFSKDDNPIASLNVLLLWQPEEETGLGSQKMLDAGILQGYNVKAIYAIHNIPGFAENEVVLTRKAFAAASTGLEIHLRGRQTHASTPEKGVNPGLAVARLVERFQTLNRRKPFQQSTLIYIRLGSEAFGTSAGEATMAFTLRAFANEEMKNLLQQAQDMANQVAEAEGLCCSTNLREPFYATENDAVIMEQVETTCHRLGRTIVHRKEPFRWSEDFANYLMHYPGAMFGIGSGENHAELHHPDYDFPDALIEPTAELFFQLIIDNK
ncbi:MAG: amidohydrolase [Bacteroidales bacterium]|nr:amidohydrolase [Bacteroidales bacterium]